jgi:hypothetical protein
VDFSRCRWEVGRSHRLQWRRDSRTGKGGGGVGLGQGELTVAQTSFGWVATIRGSPLFSIIYMCITIFVYTLQQTTNIMSTRHIKLHKKL